MKKAQMPEDERYFKLSMIGLIGLGVMMTAIIILIVYQIFAQTGYGYNLALIILELITGVLMVSFLRVFLLKSELSLFWKIPALLMLWLVFLLFVSILVSLVFIPKSFTSKQDSLYIALFVAMSFWLIDNAGKSTMEVLTVIKEKL